MILHISCLTYKVTGKLSACIQTVWTPVGRLGTSFCWTCCYITLKQRVFTLYSSNFSLSDVNQPLDSPIESLSDSCFRIALTQPQHNPLVLLCMRRWWIFFHPCTFRLRRASLIAWLIFSVCILPQTKPHLRMFSRISSMVLEMSYWHLYFPEDEVY